MAQAQSESNNELEGERSLASNLAKTQPFFVLNQGCWTRHPIAESIKIVQALFKPRHDDIFLATYPKCGTTWLKALAFAITNRFHHASTSDEHPLCTRHPQRVIPFIEMPDRRFHPLAELETLTSPRILCTHMPLALLPPSVSTLGCRIVYLCREPKDVLVSCWHFFSTVQKEYSLDTAFELFCEGVSSFGPIWEHYLGYWKLSKAEADRVLFLKYEEIMADPIKHVKMLAEFLRAPFTDEEVSSGVVEELVHLCSFKKLKSLPVNSSGICDVGWLPLENSSFFRTGKVGDWKNHLTEEKAIKLDCIIQEKLKGSGLTF